MKTKQTKQKKTKSKITILKQYTDSFGTLHVKFIGHDGHVKEVSFDERDHAAFGQLTKS